MTFYVDGTVFCGVLKIYSFTCRRRLELVRNPTTASPFFILTLIG